MKPALKILAFSLVAAMSLAGAPAFAKMQHLHKDVAALVAELKQGGHVLFIRHERTDAKIADAKGFDVAHCASQRNLSTAGVANAQENGEMIRFLEIPVSKVLSSPMCRTQETARLLFGETALEPALGGMFTTELSREEQAEAVHALIREHAGQEGNVALVSHLGVYMAAFQSHLGEGDVAVFSVQDGAPALIGVIPANGWNDAMIDATVGTRAAYKP